MIKQYIALMLLLVFCLLVGCSKVPKSIGTGNVDVNTILVRNDGTVEFSIVEEFDKPYYDKQELIEFINTAVAEYNNNWGENAVVNIDVGTKNGSANAVLSYQSVNDYAIFNDVIAENLTILEAKDSDYFPDTFVNAADSHSITKEEVLKNSNYKVLFINDALDVIVEGKIRYYSNGIMLKDNMIQTAKDGISVIVYKP